LTNPDRVTDKKQATFGGEGGGGIHRKFCYLPATALQIKIVLFWEREPAKIPCERKTIKWATELVI